jgi:hypothetical protein
MGNSPRLYTPVMLGILSTIGIAAAIGVNLSRPGNFVLPGALGLIGLIFAGGSFATGLNWAFYQYWQRDIEKRRAQAITPMLELVQAVGRLSESQIGLVGLQDYRAVIEIAGSTGGPIYMLRTAGGPIPMEFVEKTLRRSTPLGMPAIRNYPDGSPEREWIRLFTQWCIDMHLAIPANGPYSAQWIERGGRFKAATILGAQLYNESFEAVEE